MLNRTHTPELKRTAAPPVTFRQGGVWLVALGAALWGLDSLLRVPLMGAFTSTEIVLIEHLLLLLFAVPAVWIGRRQFQSLSLRHFGAILFLSWGGSGLATVLFTMGFQYGHPSVVLLLQKLQPLFVVLAAKLLLNERLPRGFSLYLLVALGGTYLLTFGLQAPFLGATGGQLTGSLLSIGAAVLWGGSTVMGRYLLTRTNMSFETLTGARFLFAVPLLFGLAVLSGSSLSAMGGEALKAVHLSMFLLLALLPGLLGILFYYRGLSSTPASSATLAELAFPATGVLLNWLFLDKGLTVTQAVGFALIWWVVYQLSVRR
ncbi:putative membrane protein [Tumebacillus sp. BK434]|nr:putative membrane protein [Tumebacillus sp. BK434]